MASVKGFTLKGVTNFKGHEGEPCIQGSIYYNGKKVGYYSDSFSMGMPDVTFTDNAAEEAAKKAGRTCYEKHSDMSDDILADFDIEMLFNTIIDLMIREKEYKKGVKKGFPIFATYITGNGVETMVSAKSREVIERSIGKERVDADIKFYEEKDFIIE
jgi:hypothetical protein